MFARLAATAFAALSLSAHAAPTTIGFEDIDTSVPFQSLSDPYQGFVFDGTWGNDTWIVSPDWFGLYDGNDAHSGTNYVWGNGGEGIDMTLTRVGGGSFDFDSVWARGGDDSVTMVATGFRGGVQVVSATFSDSTTYSLNQLNFFGVDQVKFSMVGGNLLLDDLVVNVVPEPMTPALLLAGLGLVGLMVRRRRA